MRIILVMLCLWSIYGHANVGKLYQITKIEVIGGDSHIKEGILMKYGIPILNWLQGYYQQTTQVSSENVLREYVKNEQFFEQSILKQWNFAYVKIEPIIYPASSEIIISVIILEKNREWPISYFNHHILGKFPDKDNLITHWFSYEMQGTQLAIAGELSNELQQCHYYHCLFGFTHQKLKKYENLWSHLTQSQTRDLYIISRFDKRETYRAAAVFILGHVKQCTSLYEFISSALLDSSNMVRNNALRVYAMSLEKCHYAQVPWRALSINLNYPSLMLNNKAMAILNILYHDERYRKYIEKNYMQRLIELSDSIQPNLNQFNFHKSQSPL